MALQRKKDLLYTILVVDAVIFIAIVSLLGTNHFIALKSAKPSVTVSNQQKATEFALEATPKQEVKEEEVKEEAVKQETEPVEQIITKETIPPKIVYDGMTMDELAAKLDRSLGSSLSGYGRTFANYSIELGMDPYLAVAIVLHETGCKWGCSNLVQTCNNIGGQKGSGCNGYQYFSTLEEGIKGYMDNLYYNYYAQGLTTPELMNPKYAASTTWAEKVNSYMASIKAS